MVSGCCRTRRDQRTLEEAPGLRGSCPLSLHAQCQTGTEGPCPLPTSGKLQAGTAPTEPSLGWCLKKQQVAQLARGSEEPPPPG